MYPELVESLAVEIVQKHDDDTHKYELIILGTNVQEHTIRLVEKKVKLNSSLAF
jgi:hypothetical protein